MLMGPHDRGVDAHIPDHLPGGVRLDFAQQIVSRATGREPVMPASTRISQADALPFGRITYEMIVRGAVEACRPEAREPAGARLGGGGDAVRAQTVATAVSSAPARSLAGV